ncbi:tail fiber protein [Paenibacillus sp. FSL R7-0302]|uniref:tail fiber protein n=1 Tax=Paenibacillus sp. FSL R7-0302 TaxID=2921681 RepID=UPI0030F4DD62
MAEKDILIKKKNGSDWDNIYPISKAKNIIAASGKSVEDTLLLKADLVGGKVPLDQLPDEAKRQVYVVTNGTARNALTGMITGDMAFETATGDTYIWNGTAWSTVADADWANVNLTWANISGKPSSTVANIDAAVTNSHTHSNKAVLDGTTASFTVALNTKLSGIATSASAVANSATNGNININGSEAVVYSHPSGDGNLHVPATGTANSGKVLTAGATAGSLSWSAIDWNSVISKPSTFAPAAHDHDVLITKADNYKDSAALPSAYDRGTTVFFSNNPANKFNGTAYCTVHTIKGYNNMAVMQYIYPYNVDAPIFYRYGLYSSDTWTAWRAIATTNIVTTSDNGLMSAADKTKLDGITAGANVVANHATNGAITINGSLVTVYTHPSGDGNLHIPANGTSNGGKFLNASATAGVYQWASVTAADITQSSTARFVTDAEKTSWNAKSTVASPTLTFTAGTGALAFGLTINGSVASASATIAAATTSVNGLLTAADKAKLDGITAGANVVANSATNGVITINGANQTVYSHPTGDGNLHVPATGTANSGKFLTAGATAGSLSWNTIPDASTDSKGLVQLCTDSDSDSTTLAATASAVKDARDFGSYVFSELESAKTMNLQYKVTTGIASNVIAYSVQFNVMPSTLNGAPYEGFRCTIKPHAPSHPTTQPTLSVNGLVGVPIRQANGAITRLLPSGVYTLVYNGSAYIIQGSGGSPSAADVIETTTKKIMTSDERTKLESISSSVASVYAGASAPSSPATNMIWFVTE